MRNENTLIALAYIKETDNPLDVFCNYILICLLVSHEKKLRHDELCVKIEDKFGIKMPQHMIKMCCRILQKQKKISKLPNGAGYIAIDETYDLELYESKREQLAAKERLLVHGLLSYTEDYLLSWSYEKARDCLSEFLLTRGNAVKIFSKQKIDEIEKEKLIPDEWYVGKYIEKVLNKNDERTEYLIDIVNGLMIYIGVYETNDYFQECTQKFKGTDFYLDTKLVLRLLGYSWDLETAATKELVDLIRKDYGGNICVFDHTVGEIQSALYNASENLRKNETIVDTELRVYALLNKCSAFDLKLHGQSVESMITKLGCCIKSGVDWSIGNNQAYNLNDEELKKFIRLKHPKWKERAIDNDINTVNCINVLRKGNYTVKYGGKKKLPVFITTNTELVWCVREYIATHEEEDKNVAAWNVNALPLITDNMLMCRLWVPKAKMNSSVPAITLARNAYSAKQVNAAFFDRLRVSANDLKQKHHIDVIDISLARKEKLEELLIKNTSGDVESLSTEIIANSLDEVIKLETLNLNEQIDELKEENENHLFRNQLNKENNIRSAVIRFQEKLEHRKIVIVLAQNYWIIVAIIFACTGLLIGQIKGILGGLYAILTIINKVMEKCFNRSSWGEYFVSHAVKLVWNSYSKLIRENLLDFEKELEDDILRACIENDELLLKYQQYCI